MIRAYKIVAAGALGLWVGALSTLGCTNVYEEILNPPKTAGGAITASIDDGTDWTTTALARNKSEPFTVEGTSNVMTFALTAADETSGSTAKARLTAANTQIELLMSATGRNKIEIHAEGKGCISDGKSGHITLVLDGSSKLGGDFELGGTRTDAVGGSCIIKGTIANVPVSGD